MTSMQDPNCTANQSTCAYTPRLDTGLGTVHGVTNVFDSSNRVIRQYDDRGVVTEFAYASDGDPTLPTLTTTITEHPTPSTSVQTVDKYRFNELVSETKAYGTSQAATWQYAYRGTWSRPGETQPRTGRPGSAIVERSDVSPRCHEHR
jgi:hypothetical protein